MLKKETYRTSKEHQLKSPLNRRELFWPFPPSQTVHPTDFLRLGAHMLTLRPVSCPGDVSGGDAARSLRTPSACGRGEPRSRPILLRFLVFPKVATEPSGGACSRKNPATEESVFVVKVCDRPTVLAFRPQDPAEGPSPERDADIKWTFSSRTNGISRINSQ